MKKLAFYMSLIVTGLLMAACNEDFKDWANQKTYLPEDAITIPGFTASAISAEGIDLNAVTDETVQLVSLKGSDDLPKGYLLTGIRAYLFPADIDGAEAYELDAVNAEGFFSVKDLQEAVVKFYGIRPTARTFKAHIYADAIKDGQSALIDAGETTLILTPIAPIIEEEYYVTGNITGWDNTNTTYKVSNGGKDPYENPVYVVVIPAMADGSNVEFKLTPKSGLGGDWSECIAAADEGKFNYHNNGGNLVIEADGSSYYRVLFNMLDQTWSATPVPLIEEAYYITGNVNGWNNTDTSLELSNGGKDPYEQPVFTVLIPAPEDGGNVEFKVTPKSGLGGDWSKCLTAADEPGTFATDNKGGNLVINAVEGAKFYRLSMNMMAMTYTVDALAFAEFFYEIGNEGGWSTAHALYGGNGDGKYLGYYYLDGEFKFKPNADNWNDDLEYVDGTTTGGTLTAAGGPNCPDPGAGFYQINLDAGALTYNLVKVNTISIIGDFNGWGGDVDMTYNKEEGCWEATAEVNTNGFKFRMNHDWTISWGGANGDPRAYDNLTQNNGKDLTVDADGTYKFKLYLSYEGNNKVVITKQ
jgi:hypothetical protein